MTLSARQCNWQNVKGQPFLVDVKYQQGPASELALFLAMFSQEIRGTM